jgi:hypothetical protein
VAFRRPITSAHRSGFSLECGLHQAPKGSGQQIGNNNALASRRNGPFSRSLILADELDLVRAEVSDLGGPQAKGDGIAVTVAVALGGLDQTFDLGDGQVFVKTLRTMTPSLKSPSQ